MTIASRWPRLWQRLGVPQADERLHRELLQRWREPHRHYHGLRHLEECLVLLDQLHSRARRPEEIELALWFHDAVYDPRRQDNEQESADWAHLCALRSGLSETIADRIHGLVMATRHGAAPHDPDQQLLVDIDLAILGAPPLRFEEYERDIRREYAFVPEPVFRRERRRLLREFQDRRRIYSTAWFQEHREAQARHNLERSLKQLEGEP